MEIQTTIKEIDLLPQKIKALNIPINHKIRIIIDETKTSSKSSHTFLKDLIENPIKIQDFKPLPRKEAHLR